MRPRAARQMTLGLVPLVVLAAGLLVILYVHDRDVAGPVTAASATATGTVTELAGSGDPRHGTVTWTDRDGHRQQRRIAFPAANPPANGDKLTVHYPPSGKGPVFASGDVTYRRLGTIGGGIFYCLVVLVLAVLITGARALSRRRAERLPPTDVRVSRVRIKLGILQRSWLVVADGGREWWLPVYWEPILPTLLGQTPATLHGRVGRGVAVVRIGDTTLWPSGRARLRTPRGGRRENPGSYSKAAARRLAEPADVSMARQALDDAPLLLAAPLLGVLWSYVNGAGRLGFVAATVLLAGVVFWLPTVYGSDPS